MLYLKQQIPFLYWVLRTLWEVIVTASTSLLIFLCISIVVYLFTRLKQA